MSALRPSSLLGLAFAVGCGCSAPDPSPPYVGSSGAAGQGTGGQRASGGSAGPGSEGGNAAGGSAAGGSAAGVPAAGASAGSTEPFVIDDLADSPCVATTASRTVVMEPEPLQLVYDRMGHVADRIFAFDSATMALLTFDATGSEPSPIRYDDFLAVAAVDDQLALVRMTGADDVVLELADSSAVVKSEPLTLATGGSGSHGLGVGPELILAMRRSGTRLEGELIRRDGNAVAATFDLGEDSCGAFECRARAGWNGVDYTLVWSRVLQNQRSKLSWVRVSSTGNWQFPKTIALTDEPLELVDLVRLSTGYALLLSARSPSNNPVVARLDDFGNPAGALRLLGARDAWGIAKGTSGLGVVAGLEDGRAAFRPFTLTGEATSGWVCLDDSPPDIGFHSQATIAEDADGFDFVVRMTDGSATYLRTDALGMTR